MAPRKQLVHKQWSYLNPQYDSYTNPVTPHEQPYIVAGSNVLTSRRGVVERMPGSSVYETTATQLAPDGTGATQVKTYIYKKFNGNTFIIVGVLSAVTAKVYKLLVGGDTAFVQLLSVNSAFNWDFVTANDTLYMASGGNVYQYQGSGTTTYLWGISATATSSTYGPSSPTSTTSSGSLSPVWTNVNNVQASDSVYATTTFTGGTTGQVSSEIVATTFGFASAGTISEVTVEIKGKVTGPGTGYIVYIAYLYQNGAIIGISNSAVVPSAEAYVTLGGVLSLWNVSLTPAEINAAGFGCYVYCYSPRVGQTWLDGVVSADHIRMTVKSTGSTAPTTSVAGTGITAGTGWKYVYAFKNSATGHISSPSPVSLTTGAVSNKTVTVTGARSTQTSVDKVRLYRTTDGGDEIYYFIYEFANPGAGNWTQADTTADLSLDTSYGNQAPPSLNNDPPSAMIGLKSFASRIWGFYGNTLYYSGWEEINTGMEEESFPSGVTGTFWTAPQEITNLAVLPDKLLIFCRGKVFQVTGDSRSTFSFLPLFENMGCSVLYNRGVIEDGERVFWLNNDNRLWVTNGDSKELVSESVTDDFINIDVSDFSMTVHRYGEYNWLVVADNNGSTTGAAGAFWYVLDLSTGKWMPPWSRSATHMVSAELSNGQFTLLYSSYDGATSTKNIIRQVDIPPRTRTYQDTSTPYTANAVFALTDIAPPGFVFEAEHVGYERDDSGSATAPVVRIKADEANSAVTWASQTAGTQVAPTLRTAGSTLVEKWAYFKQNCRRILVRFEWTNENKNFKLISLDLTGRIIGGDD